MPLEQHPLSREFPDFHAELKQLHGNDAHFTRLAADYESLDKRIYEVEGGRDAWRLALLPLALPLGTAQVAAASTAALTTTGLLSMKAISAVAAALVLAVAFLLNQTMGDRDA